MMEKKEKKIRYMVCRGQARAVPSYWIFVVWKAWSGTGRAKVLAVLAQFFFSSFSGIVLGQLPTKQLKTNKEQTKSD